MTEQFAVATNSFQQVKFDLHKKILDRLDLQKLGKGAMKPSGAKCWP